VHTLLCFGLGNALLAIPLAVVATLCSRLCRRPALTHSLWLLVLLKLVTPPFLPVEFSWPVLPERQPPRAERAAPSRPAPQTISPAPGEDEAAPPAEGGQGLPATGPLVSSPEPPPAPAELPAAPLDGEAPVPAAPEAPRVAAADLQAWEPLLAVLWLGGSAAWFALAVQRVRRFRRVLRFARPAPAPLQDRARRLAARLGLGRCPGVWFLPGPVSPMLWALAGPPRLLLPAALWDRLDAGQQDALLAHELAHVRRHDHWVRQLELLAVGLYWWHPAMWLARQELREAEEQCCDAWVVWALPGAAAAYAAALVETVTFLAEARAALPVAASGIGHLQHLKRRLTMIVRGTTPRALGGAGLAAVLGLGALLLPLFPTRAQTPPPALPRAAEPPATPAGNGELAPEQPPAIPSGVPAVEPPREPREEIDVLKAQLDGKMAELAEAKAQLQKARRQAARMENLHAQGAVSQELIDEARTEVEVQEARVQAREAQVREAKLRLRRAERRGNAPRGQAGPAGGLPAAPAVEAPPGLLPRNAPPAGDRAPALERPPGLAPAAPPPAADRAPAVEGAPDRAQNRVDYGRPRAPDGSRRAPPRDVEQRLRDLEQKVDRLLEEMRELLKQVPGGVLYSPAPTPPVLVPAPPGNGNALEVPAPPPRRPDPRSTPTVPLNRRDS
jgi:beta-lactamase regulating signal transducer with metallopeptidase domain